MKLLTVILSLFFVVQANADISRIEKYREANSSSSSQACEALPIYPGNELQSTKVDNYTNLIWDCIQKRHQAWAQYFATKYIQRYNANGYPVPPSLQPRYAIIDENGKRISNGESALACLSTHNDDSINEIMSKNGLDVIKKSANQYEVWCIAGENANEPTHYLRTFVNITPNGGFEHCFDTSKAALKDKVNKLFDTNVNSSLNHPEIIQFGAESILKGCSNMFPSAINYRGRSYPILPGLTIQTSPEIGFDKAARLTESDIADARRELGLAGTNSARRQRDTSGRVSSRPSPSSSQRQDCGINGCFIPTPRSQNAQ